MFHCRGDYDDIEPLFFVGCCLLFSLAGFCHKSEKVSRKKAIKEAENSLRDRSYCWRVLSDQVRINNIIFAIVGNTGIVFLGVANNRPISAAYAYQYCLLSTI